MNATIINKIEIAFWELFIDVVSRSRYARSIIKFALKLRRTGKLDTYLGMIALAGMFGLLLGFVVPQFITIFR